MILFRNLFQTLGLLYGTGVTMRNTMFDNGMLKSVEFDVPVIGIGNIRVGGTGKTPFVIWLIEHLQTNYKVAVLSRGYGRKTSGFRFVNVDDTSRSVGDEPLQVKRKFPDVSIAVCEDRVVGITNILADVDADVILLDDAFQHRYVRPSYQVVLSTFHQPFFTDELLPVGRLREHPKHLKRANCIIYTKCPDGWEDQRERYIEQAKRFAPNALVCFSTLQYDAPKPLFNTSVDALKEDVLLVTGIADSKPLLEHLRERYHVVRHYDYPDHYRFMHSDVENWKKEMEKHSKHLPVIMTTEKDAMRLSDISDLVNDLLVFYLPMKMMIVEGENELTQALTSAINRVKTEMD